MRALNILYTRNRKYFINISKCFIELLPTNIPQHNEWWYYAPTSGQHIAFYSKSTLEFLAKKYNLFFYSTGFLHLFTKHKLKRCQPLPFKYNLLSNNKNLFNYISKL